MPHSSALGQFWCCNYQDETSNLIFANETQDK